MSLPSRTGWFSFLHLLLLYLLHRFQIIFLPVNITSKEILYLKLLFIAFHDWPFFSDLTHNTVLWLLINNSKILIISFFGLFTALILNFTIFYLLVHCFLQYDLGRSILKADLGDFTFIVCLGFLVLELPVTYRLPFAWKVNFKLFLQNFLSLTTITHEIEKFICVDLLLWLSLYLIFFVDIWGFLLQRDTLLHLKTAL